MVSIVDLASFFLMHVTFCDSEAVYSVSFSQMVSPLVSGDLDCVLDTGAAGGRGLGPAPPAPASGKTPRSQTAPQPMLLLITAL